MSLENPDSLEREMIANMPYKYFPNMIDPIGQMESLIQGWKCGNEEFVVIF